MLKQRSCVSCSGTGERPTENGVLDCPDCGGSGYLPSKSVLVDWRTRDLERNLERQGDVSAQDVRWLLNELRTARTALTEVISLAHDVATDEQSLGFRIRSVASRALGLYDTVDQAEPSQR